MYARCGIARKKKFQIANNFTPWKQNGGGERQCLNETVIGFAGFRTTAAVAYNSWRMTSAVPADGRAALPQGTSESEMGRILAIDYGRRRIGLALSDELGATAQPLLTIERTNRRELLRRLREICVKHKVAHIVVGHPLHMTGEAGEMAAEAAAFAMRLSKEVRIETELVDERLTTWEARETMMETKSRRKGEPIDAIAAAVLLRDYLESHSEKISHDNRRKRSES